MGEQDYGVQIAEIRGEINAMRKDVERLERQSDKFLRFQEETNRKVSSRDSEIGNARRDYTEIMKAFESFRSLEIKTRMEIFEQFINDSRAERNESRKASQARQWAFWLSVAAVVLTGLANLLLSALKG